MPGRRSWYLTIETPSGGRVGQPVETWEQFVNAVERLGPVVPDGSVWSMTQGFG